MEGLQWANRALQGQKVKVLKKRQESGMGMGGGGMGGMGGGVSGGGFF